MAATEHQHVIQTFVSNGAYPALRDRVRLRRPERRLDHFHALAAHELIERARELGVAIVHQEAHVLQPLLDRQVAALLGNPRTVGVWGDSSEVNATRPQLNARRNSLHDGPSRRGAGPRPARLRIVLIVVAPTPMPSLRSSPWIRRQPTSGSPSPGAPPAHEAQDRSAADPESGAGTSTSSRQARGASEPASAA